MIINVGGGAGGYTLTISTDASASVTVSKDGNTYTKTADSAGIVSFSNLASGIWTVTATKNSITKTQEVNITEDTSVSITLRLIPEFTYTGSYKLVDDSNNTIANPATYQGNWKIRFLTGGVFTPTSLGNAENGIDIFLVGGGGNGSSTTRGGGGAGGKTLTVKAVPIVKGQSYTITVGGSAGNTSAFGYTASAGGSGSGYSGGSGGSGGGGGTGSGSGYGGAGGSNGGSGTSAGQGSGGSGQGTTTREFGLSTGTLYSGGGGGGAWNKGGAAGSGGGGIGAATDSGDDQVINHGGSGGTNTGGGGGGASKSASRGSGGSGIVVIRNKR